MPIAGQAGDIRARVTAAVDRAFAEPVRLSFLTKDEEPDPKRPALEVAAVLRVGGGDQTNLAGGFAQTWRTQLVAGKAELHISRDEHPVLNVAGKVRVCALSRAGQPWWEVLKVDDRGDGRLVLQLGEK